MVKRVLLVCVFLFAGYLLTAQQPGYDVSFHHIFDNREYFSEFAFPQTIFGARLNASLCFEVDSIQGFAAGVNYMYEFGGHLAAVPPQLNLYYHYSSDHVKLAFGSFPRKDRINLPLSFLTDTLNYYRPNVEGAFISYANSFGNVNGFIDWTGRVSESNRETFLVGLNSTIALHHFFIEPSFLMYHNARSYSNLDSVPLQDNGIMSLLLGYHHKPSGQPEEIRISSGVIGSYNRFRPQDFSFGRGIISSIDIRYNLFGFAGVYYIGTPLVFEYGDLFYRAGNYGRVDLFADTFKNPKVDSKIGWSFHYIPGEGIHHSQQVLLSVQF